MNQPSNQPNPMKIVRSLAVIVAGFLCTAHAWGARTELPGGIPDEDAKVYSGNECRQMLTSPPGDLMHYYDGALNSASGSRWWGCPLIRDMTSSSADMTRWEVTVTQATATPWSIVLWSLNKEGTSGYTSTINVPQSVGTHQVGGSAITSAFSLGTFMVRSYVPAGSKIHSYAVYELP